MKILRARPLLGRPRVTVAIPCYNYGHYLPAAVASALDQPGVEVDVIVVDDCSSDGSREVAADLAASDPRITLVQHETNQGHIATFNDGVSRATGDYVVLMSADDQLAPGALARAAALFEARPEVALVYGVVSLFEHEPTGDDITMPHSWSVWSGPEWVQRTARRGRNIIFSPEAVLRTSVMHELGSYEAAHPHASDMMVWLRAAELGAVGRVNGPVHAYYREHGDNMHSTMFAGVLTDLRHQRHVFDAFVTRSSLGTHDRQLVARRSNRALAREAMLRAGVEQAGGAEQDVGAAVAFADFALECDPGVRRTRRWSSYERRLRHGVSPAEARLLRASFDLRWRLRWQRWARFGT